MQCIERTGKEYGLCFNWSKLEALAVRQGAVLLQPEGTAIKMKDSIVYLGSLLSSDERVSSELGRRIGQAASDFFKEFGHMRQFHERGSLKSTEHASKAS